MAVPLLRKKIVTCQAAYEAPSRPLRMPVGVLLHRPGLLKPMALGFWRVSICLSLMSSPPSHRSSSSHRHTGVCELPKRWRCRC